MTKEEFELMTEDEFERQLDTVLTLHVLLTLRRTKETRAAFDTAYYSLIRDVGKALDK